MAEAADLKSVECRFESDRGHQFNFMKKYFVDHFNHKTLSISDALGVIREYERLVKYMYGVKAEDMEVALSIEEAVKYMGNVYKTYEGKIVVKE